MLTPLEANGKRLLFFTKVILTLLLINLTLFINYVDLAEKNKMAENLVELKRIYHAVKAGDISFEKYDLDRNSWLKKNDTALCNRHTNARVTLRKVIESYGRTISYSEKGGGGGENIMRVSFSESFFRDAEMLSKANESYKEDQPDREGSLATISDAMKVFQVYSTDRPVRFLSNLDPLLMSHIIDSFINASGDRNDMNNTTSTNADEIKTDPSSNPDRHDRYEKPRTGLSRVMGADVRKFDTAHGLRTVVNSGAKRSSSDSTTENERAAFFHKNPFQYIQLKGDSLILITGISYNARSVNQDKDPKEIKMFIPVKTEERQIPSVLYFADSSNSIVSRMTGNTSLLKTINDDYGYMKLSMVDDLVSSAIRRYEDPVSILGFDISRRWFPTMLAIFLMIIYALVFITIKNASIGNEKIITGYESDDSLDLLINYKWLRFLLWVLSPLVLIGIVLYSSLIHYSLFVYSVLICAGIICIGLGYFSYRHSIKL